MEHIQYMRIDVGREQETLQCAAILFNLLVVLKKEKKNNLNLRS